MFYNKELKLYAMSEGHKDQDNIWVEGGLNYTKTILADVQPYSQDLLKRQYGYDIEVSKRIFCDIEDIKIGSILKYKDDTYEVRKIILWDDYMELMCMDTDVVLNG